MHSIAIFGGTFDPVHNGHIQTSLTIQNSFKFDTYCFLPCKVPTLKPPTLASTQQRIEMLQLAIKPYPQFTLDLREIVRDTPSYMVDTLESFRKEHKASSITLILGYDAFLSLPQWHQWERIFKLANLLIINRDKYSKLFVPDPLKGLLLNNKTNTPSSLLTKQAGAIYFFNAGNYDISSTEIRQELKKNTDITAKLSNAVYDYIKEHVRNYFRN